MTVEVRAIKVVQNWWIAATDDKLTAITVTLADGRQKYVAIGEPFDSKTLGIAFETLGAELRSL